LGWEPPHSCSHHLGGARHKRSCSVCMGTGGWITLPSVGRFATAWVPTSAYPRLPCSVAPTCWAGLTAPAGALWRVACTPQSCGVTTSPSAPWRSRSPASGLQACPLTGRLRRLSLSGRALSRRPLPVPPSHREGRPPVRGPGARAWCASGGPALAGGSVPQLSRGPLAGDASDART
jgi:hypothetical protein